MGRWLCTFEPSPPPVMCGVWLGSAGHPLNNGVGVEGTVKAVFVTKRPDSASRVPLY